MGRFLLSPVLAFALAAGIATAAEPDRRSTSKLRTKQVLEHMSPDRFKATPSARRIAIKHGLLGIGEYAPPGYPETGANARPTRLFPRAGVGVSLNVDPLTGQPYIR